MPRRATDTIFERRLAALINSRVRGMASLGLRGLEKETLRVTPAGRIALTQHPRALGSALCHPNITTDYSEALLELVTPTFDSNVALLTFLRELQSFVYGVLEDELLWCASMPCELDGDLAVPIANYGSSHLGRFKNIYRRGLLTRYGGMMQAIAGVHFNYSLPQGFWPVWAEVLQSRQAGADFISARYFDLLRNFRRHGWIVSWLFGASPALCASFVPPESRSGLQPLARHSMYDPDSTSLRMSDLGYRNRNQAAVTVSVNNLEDYLRDLLHAVHTPHPPFQQLGVQVNGEYRQLSANILQIENEYYSSIRPKRAPRGGELTAHALQRAGVEYVEVRSLDLDCFTPESVTLDQLNFMEALQVYLLLKDSPPVQNSEQEVLDANLLRVTRSGRAADLALDRDGRSQNLTEWAAGVLDEMQGVCELLDAGATNAPYKTALRAQQDKVAQPQLLPSARLQRELQKHDEDFAAWTLRHSQQYAQQIRQQALTAAQSTQLVNAAGASLQQQQRLERESKGSFEQFLSAKLAPN
jgi:glutamate--cysteine ligase